MAFEKQIQLLSSRAGDSLEEELLKGLLLKMKERIMPISVPDELRLPGNESESADRVA